MPEVKLLPVDCLYPHPNNPRQELGDLAELAASIKANGIFQNLTVVPVDNVESVLLEHFKAINAAHSAEEVPSGKFYVVVIGHRRLAAAKLAGIPTVPCTIVEMSPQEQVRTMLIENIQRSELTPYEQAQGFQMMLNLGETVETIAKNSGFSVSTIRGRVKLLSFDDQTFRDATAKQITLETLSEVAKIDDAKKRDKVLAAYGSNNFQYELQDALAGQAAKKNAPAAKKEILAYATEVKDVDYSHYNYVLSVRFSEYKPGSATPKDGTKGEFVVTFAARSATVYKKAQKAKTPRRSKAEIEREKEIKRREAELAELTEAAYNLRRAFIEKLTVGKADYPKLLNHAVGVMLASKIFYCGSYFDETYTELLGIERPKVHLVPKALCQYLRTESESKPQGKSLIAAIYAGYGDNKKCGYWTNQYGNMPVYSANNEALNYLYDFLCDFGYELSDVEKSLKDGTHPLFAAEAKKQETSKGNAQESTDPEKGNEAQGTPETAEAGGVS